MRRETDEHPSARPVYRATPSTPAARPEGTCAQLTAAKTARVPPVRSSTQCPQRASNYEEPASSGLLPLTIERLEEPRTAAILRPVAQGIVYLTQG